MYLKRKWNTVGFDESAMLQRIKALSLRSSVGTSRQVLAGTQNQVQTSSSGAVVDELIQLLSGASWRLVKKQGFTQVLLCPFPLPDQHWSDDIPSDAETELRMQHQAALEAELELRVSENEEEQPATTPGHQERGKPVVSAETASRIPVESLQGQGQHRRHRSSEQSQSRAGALHTNLQMADSSACCCLSPFPLHRSCAWLWPTAPFCVCSGAMKG